MCGSSETKNALVKGMGGLRFQRTIPRRIRAESASVSAARRIRHGTAWAWCIAAAFIIACLLNTGVAHVEADEPLKVLVLNSYHRGYDWSDRIMDAVRTEFDKTGLHIDLYFEYMDARRYSFEEAFSYSKELCSAKYHDVQFDVIICSDLAAFYFFLGNRDLLFAGAPMVFCGIQRFDDSMLQDHKSVTGVVEAYDYKSTIDVALEFHPSVGQIVLISEYPSAFLEPYKKQLESYMAQLNRQVEIVHFSLAELTMTELLEKIAGLGGESVLLLISAMKDSTGETFKIEQSMEMIQQHCSVPIYVVDSRWLGFGPVGGKLADGGYQGQAAALMAIRILNGEDPNNIPVLTESPNAYMFDYIQLKRFGIPLSDVPEGSIIVHEPQSFYYLHRKQVWAVAGLIGGLTLIILLLSVNILRRKRAEEKLHKAEAKYRTLVEQIPAITYIAALDRASSTLYVSPQMETIIGFSPEEYKADPDIWRKQLHPDDRQRVLAEVQHTHETGEPLCCEYRMLARDGRVVWLRDEALVVTNDNSEPLFLQGVMVDVTERRKSEDELKESEERFRAIFDNATDGILLADPETKKFTACNETICQMLGYDLDELKNLSIKDIHPEEHLAYVMEQFEKQARGEITLAKDIPLKRKDGSSFYADVNSAPVTLGGKTYLMGLFRDITERRQAEAALRESQELFDAFMGQLPATAFIKDENSRVKYVNSFMAAYFGADKWIDHTALDYYPPEVAKGVLEHDRRVLAEGASSREEWVPIKSGEIRCLNTYKFPIKQHGKPPLIGGMAIDITERKNAQEEIEAERKKLADIIDGMVDGVTIIDMSGKIITINKSTVQQHGYTAEEVIGKTPAEIFVDERDIPKFHDAMKRLIGGEEIRGHEYLAKRKDGTTFPVGVNLSPLNDIGGKTVAIIAVHRDITDRKRAEQTLQRAHDELEVRVKRRTAELARVRSLASELSLAEEHTRRRMATDIHDHVSQKLAISKMKLESLAELVRSSKVAKALQEISDLVAQTIKSTRSLTFELSPPVLYELGFEAALEWLTKQARQQHGLSTEFTDDGQAKSLDDDVCILLFQAVRELLVNVVKHSKAKNVAVSTRRSGSEVQVSVEDDGVGFDTSVASSANHSTSGFGLFSIHERLGHIGGHLDIASKPGQGTRINLVAPINHIGKKSKRRTR